MKFNDGYWLLRQGVTAAYAKQAFAVETSESDFSIAVLTRPVEHRGSHLNTADDHRRRRLSRNRCGVGPRLPADAHGATRRPPSS